MIKMLVGLRDWVDARLPIMRAWDTHMGKYYAPKNFNFWYFFGVLFSSCAGKPATDWCLVDHELYTKL